VRGLKRLLAEHRAAGASVAESIFSLRLPATAPRAAPALRVDYLLASSSRNSWPGRFCAMNPGECGPRFFWDSGHVDLSGTAAVAPRNAEVTGDVRARTLDDPRRARIYAAMPGPCTRGNRIRKNGSEQTPHFAYVDGRARDSVYADSAIASGNTTWRRWSVGAQGVCGRSSGRVEAILGEPRGYVQRH